MFWPHPDDARVDFTDTAFKHHVPAELILDVMAADPVPMALEPNAPHDDDFVFGTPSTLANVKVDRHRRLEIALRQDLSDKWKEICDTLNLQLPRCVVFHAMYKSI